MARRGQRGAWVLVVSCWLTRPVDVVDGTLAHPVSLVESVEVGLVALSVVAAVESNTSVALQVKSVLALCALIRASAKALPAVGVALDHLGLHAAWLLLVKKSHKGSEHCTTK